MEMKGFEAIIQFSPYNLVMVKDTNIKINLKCHSEYKMGVKANSNHFLKMLLCCEGFW